jgi:hypothetical protein
MILHECCIEVYDEEDGSVHEFCECVGRMERMVERTPQQTDFHLKLHVPRLTHGSLGS